MKHAVALDNIKPRIESKWGTVWNGVHDQKKPAYPHVRSNLKRAQLQDERFQAIELENYLLLGKLSKILERSHNPTHRTREWGGGVRLTSNQVPVIDHCVPQHTTEFGGAVEPTSLNIGFRQQQQDRIAAENRELVKRLQMSKPTYERSKLHEDWKYRESWLLNQKAANRPIIFEERPANGSRQRPASATVGRRRPDSASTVSSERAPRRSDRPRTAVPKQPSKPAPPIEKSVVTVLDLLSSQMKDATSLSQVRQKRDVLMDSTFEFPLEKLDLLQIAGSTAGVPIEVVSPKGATGDAVLLLGKVERAMPHTPSPFDAHLSTCPIAVHGGMFMSGSAKAIRHMAAFFAEKLQVAVATPVLRLAPEERYPAALDDLCTAYDFISSHGVVGDSAGGSSAGPSRIGLFAESSGGALALGLALRLKARGQELPSALALASPWLDLTCSGGSYIVNEDYDLVLQKERMMGIVRHATPHHTTPHHTTPLHYYTTLHYTTPHHTTQHYNTITLLHYTTLHHTTQLHSHHTTTHHYTTLH